MSDVKIDSLQIEAKTNLKDAISDIDKLKDSLSGLGDGRSGIDSYSKAITGLTRRLTELVGISDKNGIASVQKSISDLGKAAIKIQKMSTLEKKGTVFSDDAWDDVLINAQTAMENVKSTIAKSMDITKPLSDTDKAFNDYIRKAGKVHIPVEVKAEFKRDKEYANMRSVLGKNFSSAAGGIDFSKFVEEMNAEIGTTFDTSQNAADLFADVVGALKEVRQEASMTIAEVLKSAEFPTQKIETELSNFAAHTVPEMEKNGLTEDDIYSAEETSQTGGIDSESIKAVAVAVKGKTKAFEQEQSTVTNVVSAEMKDLINLRATVESVTKAVGGENGLSDAFKKLATSGLSELAALKDIDFSGIAKLNVKDVTKAIQGVNTQKVNDAEIGASLRKQALEDEFKASNPEALVAKSGANGEEIEIPTKLSEIKKLYQELINYKDEMISSINETWNDSSVGIETSIDKIKSYKSELEQTRASILQVTDVLRALSGPDVSQIEAWENSYNELLVKARAEGKEAFGTLEIPNTAEEMNQEYDAVATRIEQIKSDMKDAVISFDTESTEEMVADLAMLLANVHDLNVAASEQGIKLHTPTVWKGDTDDWQPSIPIPPELLEQETAQEEKPKLQQEIPQIVHAAPQNAEDVASLQNSLSDLGITADTVEQKLQDLLSEIQALPDATTDAESQARTMLTQSAQQLGLSAESIENALTTMGQTVNDYAATPTTAVPMEGMEAQVGEITTALNNLDSALDIVKLEVNDFASTGELSATALESMSLASNTADVTINQMASSVNALTGNLSAYRQTLSQLAQEGGIFSSLPEKASQSVEQTEYSFSSLKSELKNTIGAIADSIRSITFSDITNGTAKAIKAISSFASKAKIAIKAITSISSSIATVGKNFVSFSNKILNFGSGNNALFHPFSKGAESLANFNDKLHYGLKKAMQYGFGIRSLFILFNKLRSVIEDGLDSLVMYSDNANNSISLLKSDVSYVGNSLAAAFEPILNTIAPIIDQVVDYLVMGINAINAFFASLTGKSTYTVAIKNITSYRDSLSDASDAGDDAADATDKVKDSAEDLKRELMGFDEIEKLSEDLDDAANSGSGGNGGNGGSGGNSSDSGEPISFTEKAIPGATSDFADLVKEAWANADFTEIGNIVGTKLKEALDSIDWAPIQEQAKKIAKCTATFINGFFETEGLDDSVGRTIGEALNTAIGAITTFVDTTHWDSIGEFMSGGLRSAIATIDWTGLGQVLNAKYKALWNFLDGFVVDMSAISFEGTTGWQEAGNAIAETINSIFAERDYTAIGATIAAGINGIVSTLDTTINNINFAGIATNFANGINKIFKDIDWTAIGNLLANGLNVASSSLLNFATTIDWTGIGSSIASAANQFLAKTDFSQAGAALGSAFKGALSSLNSFAAKFDWYNLGTQIRNFIIGIDWGGLLLTAAETIAHTFFGLFETAWGLVFGGGEKSEYAQIASDLSDAISELEVEWPTIEEDAIENFNNVSEIVDKFLDLNDKLKKNGSLSDTDTALFETYYNQIVEYAPEAASLIGEVGTAYEGTDEALRQLIEDQKNLAIQEGFKEAMETAAKAYADAKIALDGALKELATELTSEEKYNKLFEAWKSDESNTGKLEDFNDDLNVFFESVRNGTVDLYNVEGATGRIVEALTRADSKMLSEIETITSLSTTVGQSKDTLDNITTAQEEWTSSVSRAEEPLNNLKSLTDKQKESLEALNTSYGIWKNNVNTTGVEKLQTLFGSITEALSGVGGTGKNLLGGLNETLSLDVNLKASGLDTSKLTEKDKTVTGGIASITQSKIALPESARKLDLTGAIVQKSDELKDRKLNNLEGSVSKVTQTGGLTLDNLGGWVNYIGSKVQDLTLDNIGAWIGYIGSKAKNLTLDNIGAWINYIGSQNGNMTLNNIGAWIAYIGSQNGGMTLSNIGAWISNIATQVGGLSLNGIGAWISYIAQTGGLSLSGIFGYVNQVARQSGFSLILSGITGLISSIAGAFKADGGAYYGGKWHTITQFSGGGVITPTSITNFNTIPKYASGTLNAGSMFIAGEAGPELVGHVGGRTEVLNQSQLAAVMESAVASGMAQAYSNGGGNVTVNVVLQGDAKKIFEVVKKENNSRVMQTGRAQLLT